MIFVVARVGPYSIPAGREEDFGTNPMLAIGINVFFIREAVRNVVRFGVVIIVQASKSNVLLSVCKVALEIAAGNHSQTRGKRMDFLSRLVPLKVVATEC